ncbi:MAG: restriction endonuclease [Bacteroidetes bacterium]|nr:MAG: restriction endonuclease [Bacteroidota bacterium]
MEKASFDEFIDTLCVTKRGLDIFCDFEKINDRVKPIAVKLNQLNYLIGEEDLAGAVHSIWLENPRAFEVLPILIAVRSGDEMVLGSDGEPRSIASYLTDEASVVEYIRGTGLDKVLQSKRVKNLVDYVFGVETGLDTNGRKNRGGHLMKNIVAEMLNDAKIPFSKELPSNCLEQFTALGLDKTHFDFVIETPGTVFLIKTNLYHSHGSKIVTTALSFKEILAKVPEASGYGFVWITDGQGWLSAKKALEEAYATIPYMYNLSLLPTFTSMVKRLLNA